MGGPVNIESVEDMFGIRSMGKVAAVERGALVSSPSPSSSAVPCSSAKRSSAP